MHFFPTFEHCGRKDVNRLEFNMKPFIFCVFNGKGYFKIIVFETFAFIILKFGWFDNN